VIVTVRAAIATDLEPVLVIAERRRRQYGAYQPHFWNPAPDAVTRQREFFGSLITDSAWLFAVAVTPGQVLGFVIARVVPAPPVYDPGGATCLIDDFTVDEPESWSEVGPQLLTFAQRWASERGAAQVVVVTAAADDPKRAMLNTAGLSLASEWWVGRI
jgi:GNAT superfamily N-acetyltransferase